MFQPRWALHTADAQEPLGQVAFFSLLSAELLKAKMNVISSVVALLRLRSVSLKHVNLRRVRRMRSDCRLMSASYPLQFISFLFLFSLLSFPLSSLMSDMKWKKHWFLNLKAGNLSLFPPLPAFCPVYKAILAQISFFWCCIANITQTVLKWDLTIWKTLHMVANCQP